MGKSAKLIARAKARIADEKNWIKGDMAHDGQGEICPHDEPQAVCFCAMGALMASAKNPAEYRQARVFVKKAYVEMGGKHLAEFNDKSDHQTVMKMLDRAAELANAEEKE